MGIHTTGSGGEQGTGVRMTINHRVLDRVSSHHEDVEALARSYRVDREPAVLDRIVAAFEPTVRLVAHRNRWTGEPMDDLVQVAHLGLLAAAERFDPERQVLFHTYAVATMTGMLHHHHRSVLQFTVPRSAQDMHSVCRSAVERLTATLKRTPTTDEVAAHVGIGKHQVSDALAIDNVFHPVSLSSAAREPEGTSCVDDGGLESTADRAEIHDALTALPDRQRTILFLHFFDGRTQSEIGAELGISQVQVSRLMSAALVSMRTRIAAPVSTR